MNEWISVDDKLPDKEGQYLCFHVVTGEDINGDLYRFTSMEEVPFLQEDGDVSPLFQLGIICFDVVELTHWMPLPEPPKERL